MSATASVTPFVRIDSLYSIQRPENIGQLFVVPVRIAAMAELELTKNRDGTEDNRIEDVRVRDRFGNEIGLGGVVGREAVDIITIYARGNQEFFLRASVVRSKNGYALEFAGASQIGGDLERIGATEDEIEHAKTTLGHLLETEKSVLAYIVATLCAALGIQRVPGNNVFEKVLQAIVLQSVACGRIGNTPAAISMALVGSFSTSKSIALRFAEVLNAVSSRVSTSTVSVAGLIGSYILSGKGRITVRLGALVLAHRGLVLIEDLSHLLSSQMKILVGALCDLLERGRLFRTLRHSLDVEVEAGVIIDLNPRSTVHGAGNGKQPFQRDVGLPLDLLSRLTMIFYLPDDVDNQLKITDAMLAGIKKVGPASELASDPRVRQLHVLIALLRDSCDTVDVNKVNGEVSQRLTQYVAEHTQQHGRAGLATAALPRTAKNILKIVAACARLAGRCEADLTDVDMAFDLHGDKLCFMNMLHQTVEQVQQWKGNGDSKAARRKRIAEHCRGRTVTVEAVRATMFPTLNPITIRRDFIELGAEQVERGVWRFSPTTGDADVSPAPEARIPTSDSSGVSSHKPKPTQPVMSAQDECALNPETRAKQG